MKNGVVLFFLLIPSASFAQETSIAADYALQPWKFGLGFQLSGSNLFLFSWQSPEENPYGRSWRIEPMIGGSYTDNESALPNSSAIVTLGLGAYLRWRVRAPFDDLYFTMGPRVLVSASRTTSTLQPYPDTLPKENLSAENISTSLAFLLGPEYAIDKWGQHFTISGFFSVGATIGGRARETPNDYSVSAWSFNLTTGTGIVLRYYFR